MMQNHSTQLIQPINNVETFHLIKHMYYQTKSVIVRNIYINVFMKQIKRQIDEALDCHLSKCIVKI